jgi:hypothetical protein
MPNVVIGIFFIIKIGTVPYCIYYFGQIQLLYTFLFTFSANLIIEIPFALPRTSNLVH